MSCGIRPRKRKTRENIISQIEINLILVLLFHNFVLRWGGGEMGG